jgi:hypothetical protein
MGLQLLKFQAAVTASRHVPIAAARKVRCVEAEVRWRWTLKGREIFALKPDICQQL